MSEWITEGELLDHVIEYGPHSYDSILFVHEEGYLELDSNHERAIRESKEGGKFMIIIRCDNDD